MFSVSHQEEDSQVKGAKTCIEMMPEEREKNNLSLSMSYERRPNVSQVRSQRRLDVVKEVSDALP